MERVGRCRAVPVPHLLCPEAGWAQARVLVSDVRGAVASSVVAVAATGAVASGLLLHCQSPSLLSSSCSVVLSGSVQCCPVPIRPDQFFSALSRAAQVFLRVQGAFLAYADLGTLMRRCFDAVVP